MSAYPDEADLDMLLDEELNVRLNQVSGSGTYPKIVFDVINWAQAQGRLAELIDAAHRRNPNNEKLRRFVEMLRSR